MVLGAPCEHDKELNHFIEDIISKEDDELHSHMTRALRDQYLKHGLDLDVNPNLELKKAVGHHGSVLPYGYALQLCPVEEVIRIIVEIQLKRVQQPKYGLVDKMEVKWD